MSGPSRPGARRRVAPGPFALLLGVVLASLFVASTRTGTRGADYDLAETARAVLAWAGWAEPLPGVGQPIVELRLFRSWVAVGVGAALALSGALLQGVFRNDLASPSILGVTSGASLGASLAILAIGGYGPATLVESATRFAPLFVTLSALAGAVGVVVAVTALATTGGRISITTLLLVGIALNAIAAGIMTGVQSFVLQDFEIARSMMAWTFGTLDNRLGWHAGLIAAALALAAAVIPFVALELDLFAGGEEDAETLGVDTRRVKILALGAAALAAAVAVAVAGQIAFVGLVVPHILRRVVGRSHRALLWLCLLAGPVLLLGADLAQRLFWPGAHLQPGVAMSLVGGPLFLFLLLRNRRALEAW